MAWTDALILQAMPQRLSQWLQMVWKAYPLICGILEKQGKII